MSVLSAEEDVSDQFDEEADGPHYGNAQSHQLQVEGELVSVALVCEPE